MRTGRWARAAAMAVVLSLAPAAPLVAGPAEDIAAATEVIETLLSDKKGAEAEPLAAVALELAIRSLGAESAEAANFERLLGDSLFYQDRFAEAEPHYRAAFERRRALLGTDNLDTAVSANDLAIILKRLERYAEAEPYYRMVLEIREKLLGPDAAKTAEAAFFLARIIESNGRGIEAAGVMEQAIAKARIAYGEGDPTTVDWMIERAAMLNDAGDGDAAVPAFEEAIAAGEQAYEPNDTQLAFARQSLADLYFVAERYEEAVPLYRAALAAREVALGPDAPATISSADHLAKALRQLDGILEAEALFRRVLAAREAKDGPVSPGVADALRWIGRMAMAQDRKAEAETLFKRALDISETVLGPADVLTGFDLIALGQLYSGEERFEEARPLLERAVAIFETSEENRSSAAAGRMALSFLEHAEGDTNKAIALAEASLDDMVALAGPQSRNAADVMLSLGQYKAEAGDAAGAESLYVAAGDIYGKVAPQSRAALRVQSALGHLREAEGHAEAALTLYRGVLEALVPRYGAESGDVQPALADIGSALFALGDFKAAAEAFGQSAAIAERLATIDAEEVFQSRTGDVEDQAVARARVFDGLIRSEYRLAEAAPSTHAEQSFAVAQRVTESEAAEALAQMAARQGAGTGELAALVRERQDLVAAWRRTDLALTAELGTTAPQEGRVAGLRAKLAEADAQIAAIDQRLTKAFPEFAELQRPQGLNVSEVQTRLGDNEVLLFFADTSTLGASEGETFLWVVPKSGELHWLRLERNGGELAAAVRELRKDMGVGTNTRGPTAVARAEGSDDVSRVLNAAHEIYDVTLGEAAPLIAGRDLVIVPSKSLSALPFQALVASLPEAGSKDRYRDAGWLAREHAITILPSVASLGAAAQGDWTNLSRSPYLAFANPLLTGRSGEDRRAFARDGCTPATIEAATGATQEMPQLASLFRGAEADVAAVRALPPLPETTDEVCAIAELLGATSGTLHLGAEATEGTIHALSTEGELAAARVVHFATHGLVSGDLAGLAEPAIVLTPPASASAGDDGLLTASEVTTLKLDADWVILSACNTAAGDGGGEALSGLARAFFYAGARALMVSHWPVNSDAAVRLASGAVSELSRDPEIGRAEALRRAMVAEIEAGGARADPMSWAPFILVGASH